MRSMKSHVSYPDYADFRQRSRSFIDVAAFDITNASVSKQPDAPAERRSVVIVSGNFFRAMQIQPILGRTFLPTEDDVRGRDAVTVLSHTYWEQQFASDPGVLG